MMKHRNGCLYWLALSAMACAPGIGNAAYPASSGSWNATEINTNAIIYLTGDISLTGQITISGKNAKLTLRIADGVSGDVTIKSGCAGGKECAGRLLRDSSASFSPLQIVLTLSDRVWMLSVHNFGLPAFGRFPPFSAVAQK